MAARDRQRRLEFDGAVSWVSRRHDGDPSLVGTLRLDLDAEPLRARAAVVRSMVDSFAEDVSPGVVSRVRASLRDVPVLGLIVGSVVSGFDEVIGVPVVVNEGGGPARTVRGSLRFRQRPEPADEPMVVTLVVG